MILHFTAVMSRGFYPKTRFPAIRIGHKPNGAMYITPRFDFEGLVL